LAESETKSAAIVEKADRILHCIEQATPR